MQTHLVLQIFIQHFLFCQALSRHLGYSNEQQKKDTYGACILCVGVCELGETVQKQTSVSDGEECDRGK